MDHTIYAQLSKGKSSTLKMIEPCWMAGTIRYFYMRINSSGERDSVVLPSNMAAFT
jgi:hypothetical protein